MAAETCNSALRKLSKRTLNSGPPWANEDLRRPNSKFGKKIRRIEIQFIVRVQYHKN